MFSSLSFSHNHTLAPGANTPPHLGRGTQAPDNLDFLDLGINDPEDSFTLQDSSPKTNSAFRPGLTGDISLTSYNPEDGPGSTHRELAIFDRNRDTAYFNSLLSTNDGWESWEPLSPKAGEARQASTPRSVSSRRAYTPTECDDYLDFDFTDNEEEIAQSIESPQPQTEGKAFQKPTTQFGQLSKQEKATLLTIIASPRHLRLEEKVIQKFLANDYDYQVSRTAISEAQKILEKAGAENVHTLGRRWTAEAEDLQIECNKAVLEEIFKNQGLNKADVLIPFDMDTQPVYDHNAANSSSTSSSGQTSKSPSPKQRSLTGSPRPAKKRKADTLDSNPFQLNTPQVQRNKAGRKRNPEEQAKILDSIAKNHSITSSQLIQQGLLSCRKSAATYIGLMKYFNFNATAVLQLLSVIPRGGALPKAKQREVLTYIASHTNASTYEVMAKCKAGHDTVEGYKKHLTACGGNLQAALSKEPSKKRQKK